MNLTDAVKALIEETIRAQFAADAIDSVTTTKAADYNEEMVLKVRIVFSKKDALDARKAAGLARHIRHKLLEMDDETFPIVSFVSKADAASDKPEAA